MRWPWQRRKFKQYKLINDKYRTTHAFTVDGVKYFEFDDPHNMPAQRFFAAMAYYEELNMRCDKEFLTAHTNALEKILSQKQINLSIVAQLNINLKERLDLMPLPDFVFRLASVYFFDETERLDTFDFNYAKQKIARWKQNPETLNFFLTGPIKTLMPSLGTASANSPMFLEVAKKIDEIHRAKISEVLSQNPSTTDKNK